MRLLFILSFCFLFFPLHAFFLLDLQKETYPVTVRGWRDDEIGARTGFSRNGLRISWEISAGRTAVIRFSGNKVPLMDRFDSASVSAEIDWDGQTKFSSCDVRFRDQSGEIFQWRVPVRLTAPGIHRISIPVTPERFRLSFGGNNDKKIDFPIRFHSCIFAADEKSGSASLTLRRIELEQFRSSRLSDVRFEIETGYAARVLKRGEEKRLELRLENPGSEPLKCRASFLFRNIDGKELGKEVPELELAPRSAKPLFPEIVLPALGIWYVTARLESPDGSSVAEKKRSFCYMIPAGPEPGFTPSGGFLFGICGHTQNRKDPEEIVLEAETAALCGVKAIRQDLRWRMLERKKGKWDFSGFDRIVNEFSSRGVEIMPILYGIPAWERNEKDLPTDTGWRDYLTRVFQRWRGNFRFWEIWNEPDLLSFGKFNAPEYLELLRSARDVQRKTAPDALLFNGGFTTMLPHASLKPGFQEYILTRGSGLFDIHAFHGHGSFKGYVEQIRLLAEQRKRLSVGIPWFANETAVSSYGIGELRQAETLYKKLLFSWANGAMGYHWYELRNSGFSGNNPEHNYGLVTKDFYPRAAYPVYNMLSRNFRRHRFVRRIPATRNFFLYEFASGTSRIIAAWNDAPEKEPNGVAVFRTNAADAAEIDLMDNASPVKVRNGIVLYPVSASPSALKLKQGTAEYLGPLFRITVPEEKTAGNRVGLEFELFNPMETPEEFYFTFENAANLRFRLNAGEKCRRSVHLKFPETEKHLRKIFCRVSFAGFSFRTSIPLKQSVTIPAKRGPEDCDFILNRKDQVRSLFDADPANVDKVWSGPQDLSAKIRFARTEETLELFADVTDDKHVQPESGQFLWKGDSIQVAFQVPGQKSLWVLGGALSNSGTPELYLWETPEGFDPREICRKMKLNVERRGQQTRYHLTIPLNAVGLLPAMLRKGIRISLIVNDNDGYGRKGWAAVSEGVSSNRNAELYPLLQFE